MNHAGSLFAPDHRRLQSRCEQAPQEAQLPPQACLPALWSRIMPRITRKQARAMTAIRTRLIQLCANQSAISGDLLSRSRRSGTDAAFFDRLCRFLHFIQEVRKSQASRFPAVWAGSLRSQPVCRSIGIGSFSANGQLIGFLVGLKEHEAEQNRVAHANPNGLYGISTCSDPLHQHRIDRDAHKDQQTLKAHGK